MKSIDITNANENLSKLISEINEDSNAITFINSKGKNAVLVSEDEWKNIEETLYLSSIPGFLDNINNIRETENWNQAKIFDPDKEW